MPGNQHAKDRKPRSESRANLIGGSDSQLSRRAFSERIGAALAVVPINGRGGKPENGPTEPPVTFSSKPKPAPQTKHLTIGCFVFPRQDQIDFAGPFEVFSRIPDSTVLVIAKTKSPVRDLKGLVLTPDLTIAEAPPLDVLLVPGGLGQQALMEDQEILSLIKSQADSGRMAFSVCTGALLCGAAGILRGRLATTHWAAWDLLHYYGAIPTKSRVAVDGNYISTAGVTAGLDGALVVASLLRGNEVAQEIQLEIEYAPEPPFHSGTPETAPPEVLQAFWARYREIGESRKAEARRFNAKLGIAAKS